MTGRTTDFASDFVAAKSAKREQDPHTLLYYLAIRPNCCQVL